MTVRTFPGENTTFDDAFSVERQRTPTLKNMSASELAAIVGVFRIVDCDLDCAVVWRKVEMMDRLVVRERVNFVAFTT